MNYSVLDECPVCRKKLPDMAKEHGDKLINIQNMLVVCVRCGCVFMPKSQIKHVMDAPEKRIIDPNTISGDVRVTL